jgi:hypothetical protein
MAEIKMSIITAGFLLLTTFFAGGCLEQDAGTNPKTGFFEANVIIGPLCPVEPCEIPEAQKAEIYSARKIQIYTENRKNLVKELSPGPEGYLKTGLEAGTYLVDMKPLGIDRTADLPVKIRIFPGETVSINISIDTGIR